MATPAADADLGSVAAAGLVAAVFVAAKRTFNGFGGKLGTTAFVGCLSVAALGGLDPEAEIPEFKHSTVAVEPAAKGDAAGAD